MDRKPTLEELKKALKKSSGNLSVAADLLGVSRITLWRYQRDDKEFSDAIKESRKRVLDQCITTAKAVALGIPLKDDDGHFVGWQEKPDSQMLRYFISTLGRDEGFGENVDLTTNGKDITTAIQVEVIDRREDVERDEDSDNTDIQ
jgi:hypothetical protein